MINASGLLKDLQQELTRTVADIGAHVIADNEVRGRLETEWKHAFDAHRTGRTFEAWLEDRLTQVGVGWLLAFVFVRFCEDNRLIAEPMIGGPGDRGAVARASQQRYFAEHPHDSDREYLHGVFRHAAEMPGLSGLLAEGESPLWLVDPPADACTRMLSLFRSFDDESGELSHDFTDQDLDTRFLGDIYQDLSAQARADYALLQTPDFVEEFILDRTLTPAIEAFGLARTTLIDPTCGSGHFLLGAFQRLWQEWRTAEPAISEREIAQRALSAVTGVDLNPFAAAIARFRLLVVALKACGIHNLRDSPDFTIEVAVGDSLLWGARPGQLAGMEAAGAAADRQFLYRTEHAEDLRRVIGRRYSAVVGNPPYIVARDKALNQQYRARFPLSCSGKFSLAAPFMERFFDVASAPDNMGVPAGFVGMITSNSFMKREFGKRLVEKCIPSWDLTHVVDTSFPEIPGHNQTVILFGRNRPPVSPAIRTVMGVRGEPSTPADPSKGLVWSAIVNQIDLPGSESEFVTVADTDRARFATHPWSIGGGGAAELKETLDRRGSRLGSVVASIGITSFTLEDDIFLVPPAQSRREGLRALRPMVEGDRVRDYRIGDGLLCLFPYDDEFRPTEPAGFDVRHLWIGKTLLSNNKMFNGRTKVEEGLKWFEFGRLTVSKLKSPYSIVYAEVASQNHFVFDRGGKVFKQTAPVIKLAEGSTVDDHLALLGPLNSSIACFWLKQVCYLKTSAHGGGSTDQPFTHMYAFDASKLQQFPLPPGQPPIEIARALDSLASAFAAARPSALCAAATPNRASLEAGRGEARRISAEMIAWQEELDWTCLRLYGLVDDSYTAPPGETPPPVELGERAFEILLARQVAEGNLETAWFSKHGIVPTTDIPSRWPDWYVELVGLRIDLIQRDRNVELVERPEHKRRWVGDTWENLQGEALRIWLLDRLEDPLLWFDGTGDEKRAVCRSVAQLADRVSRDGDFMSVARLWKGTIEVDPARVLGELAADEHVPAQCAMRYRPSGISKRRQWERTWAMQRIVDSGRTLPEGLERIPVPPRYTGSDFARSSFYRLRGKLDIPKERFTSIAGAERDSDSTMVLAWAGFDHAQLAQAIGTLLVEREQTDGWDPDRRWPMVVALAEQLPWLDQWHSEIDPRWGASPAQLYRGIAEQHALAGGRTLAEIADWRPPTPTRGRKKTATKDSTP